MADNSNLSVLIVDPSPGMRGSLQNMLVQSGISKIEFAVSSGTAIKQLAKKAFDIILCEYDLGSDQNTGQDGQQLLEDLRHHKLIGLWTIFIMITSEGVYSKVVSAAELTPTDYILKPFTVDVLSNRITRAIERRMAFLPTYQLIGQGNLREAIKSCAAGETAQPRYAGDFARLRAELLVSVGDLAAAEALYKATLDAKPTAWAQLGLARTLMAQERFEEAQAALELTIATNPRLMAAYDVLARCYEATGQANKAQTTLEDAVAISPHMVRRLRRLGDVALETGDLAAAEKSYKQVVAKARYSEFRDPEDHVNLVRALVRKGDVTQATGVVRDLEKSLRGVPNAETCTAIANAIVSESTGDKVAAVDSLKTAAAGIQSNQRGLSGHLKMSVARSCLEHQLDTEATEVMLSVVNDANSDVTMSQAMSVFVKAGRNDLAESVGNKLKLAAQALVNQAAEKLDAADFKGAIQTLLEALHLAPGNVVVLNALGRAILRQIDQQGWDHGLADQLTAHIDTVRALDQAHPMLGPLIDDFNAAKRKYGIATG